MAGVRKKANDDTTFLQSQTPNRQSRCAQLGLEMIPRGLK